LNDINYNSNTFQNYIIQNNSSVNDISGLKLDIPKPIVIQRRKLEESDFKNIIYTDIGMINLGNTCYINSCLQVLIHCPNFIDKFFEKFKTLKKEEKEEALISKHFYDICYTIVDTVNTQEKYIDISNFKNEFGKKHPIYGGYNPNDSQEFCRFFLEDLSSELNEIKTKVLYREYTENDQKSKKEQDEDFDYKFKQREKSIITDIFYSQIITSFTCECKSINYSFQKILDFPLLLPENDQTVDIIDLLKSYFQPETIDYEKKCEKCQKVIKRKKEIKISRPPEILILSLQRIDENKKKLGYSVNFEENLDISEFIDKDCGYARDCKYQLFAVINHSGSINSGHYYSYLKLEQKDWFEFNDSIVKNIKDISDSSESAYALFYIKQKYINSKIYKFN
jgi:ubiquitin C-terminal hydrolase